MNLMRTAEEETVSNFKLPSEYQSGNTIHVSSPRNRNYRNKIMSHHIQESMQSHRADPVELEECQKVKKLDPTNLPRFMRPTEASRPKDNRKSRLRNQEKMGKPARFAY